MSISGLPFLVGEGLRNIRRNGLMSVAALGTVTVALTVLGAAMWTAYRVSELADLKPREFNEIAVFLAPQTTRTDTLADAASIRRMPNVQLVRVVTKEQAWHDLEETDPKLTALDQNPLPDKLEVVTVDPAAMEPLITVLNDRARFPHVHSISAATAEVKQMLRLARMVRLMCAGAVTGLFVATLLIVYNTITLTVFARRREIQIMQLVGATSGFIRFPLMLEGVFHGAVGALIGGAIVLVCGRQIGQAVADWRIPMLGDAPSRLGPVDLVFGMVCIGVLAGLVGSLLAMRRFLRNI